MQVVHIVTTALLTVLPHLRLGTKTWLLTSMPRVQSQVMSGKIRGGRSGNGAGYSKSSFDLAPANEHYTTALYKSITVGSN
jgi:hypothetical protein